MLLYTNVSSYIVPQGTKLNQLRALVRKHRAELLGDTVSGTAASAFGAATSNINQAAAKATDTASQAVQDAFDKAINTWSDTRLKGYLDARGVVRTSCLHPRHKSPDCDNKS